LEALLQRPIKISNDANCFALSEATDGAATGAAVVFGVIIGTGTGAGIVVNGHVLPTALPANGAIILCLGRNPTNFLVLLATVDTTVALKLFSPGRE